MVATQFLWILTAESIIILQRPWKLYLVQESVLSIACITIAVASTYFTRKARPKVLRRIHHYLFQICIAQIKAIKIECFIEFQRYRIRRVPRICVIGEAIWCWAGCRWGHEGLTRPHGDAEELVLCLISICMCYNVVISLTSCGGGDMTVCTIVVSGPLFPSGGFCTGEGCRAP